MAYYPVFIDTVGKKVLVVGGGKVGLEKTTGLIQRRLASITVISPKLEPALEEWRRLGRIEHQARAYREGDMAGFDWVMIATDDGLANAENPGGGRRRGIWVNAADDPQHCDFILPSVVRRGPITIAISTGGGSPAMARRVREELTDYFTEDFEALGELLAEVRRELKSRGALKTHPSGELAVRDRRAVASPPRPAPLGTGEGAALCGTRPRRLAAAAAREPACGARGSDRVGGANGGGGMTLIGAGLSHRTSPIEERERFALSTLELPAAMAHFGAAFGHTVILSTCNRTEIYVHPASVRSNRSNCCSSWPRSSGLSSIRCRASTACAAARCRNISSA